MKNPNFDFVAGWGKGEMFAVGEIATDTPNHKLDDIRALAASGYVLVPICSPTEAHVHYYHGKKKPCPITSMGKVPLRTDWGHVRPGEYPPEALVDGNYGVVLQPRDLIIDIDPRNFAAGDKPFTRLKTDIGPVESFTVVTGGGGAHVYLRKPEDFDIKGKLNDYPGIEFKTKGQQVIGPGSIHAKFKSLYAVHCGTPNIVADAPQKLLDLLLKVKIDRSIEKGTGSYVDDMQTRERYTFYLTDQAPTSGTYAVACRGRDLGLPPDATWELMVKYWVPRRMSPRTPEDVKDRVLHAYKYATGKVGVDHPTTDFDALPDVSLSTVPDLKWRTNTQGGVIKCLSNTLKYFQDPGAGISGIFAYNEFSVRSEFAHPAPWHRGRLPKFPAVTDHDLHLVRGFLATRHRYDVSIPDIEWAIANAADWQRFHPVREYLAGLKWDGTPRLDTWIKDYLGAEDGGHPEYLAAVSRKTLCAAVMRVLCPGFEFHHVLVLEGGQDIGKSSVVKILGGPWASDAPVDPHCRDTVDALQGRWFVEMAELEVMRKADEDALKAFITRPTDRVRLAYGRSTGEYPRQCVFIATKNPYGDGSYLKDPTGNRRWWPVLCNPPARKGTGLVQIDFDGLRAARDQLFAEAVMRMTQKPREKLYMHTPLLKTQAHAAVSKRHAKHEWTEAISMWVMTQQERPETYRKYLTLDEVFREALQSSTVHFNKTAKNAIAGILRDLGWVAGYKRIKGALHRIWRPAESVDWGGML